MKSPQRVKPFVDGGGTETASQQERRGCEGGDHGHVSAARRPSRLLGFTQEFGGGKLEGMSLEGAADANAETIRRWNEGTGSTWLRFQEALDAQLDEIGRVALGRAGIEQGQTVADIGCGCGHSVLQIAELVGAQGRVFAIDVSRPLLERARARVARVLGAQADRVEFIEADAACHEFPAGGLDVIYSRFGMMFFADPMAAFLRMRRALAPGGRIAFVCWQDVDTNPWMALPLLAARAHIPGFEAPNWSARTPGPFAFADGAQLAAMLTLADFAPLDIESRRVDLPIGGGTDIRNAAELLCELSPVARWLREHEQPMHLREALLDRICSELAPFVAGDGRVVMPGDVWLVSGSP